ncbi:hypothetical protein NEOLEDRAFT_1066681 [Neolentinus lepideus HHB14362 ss-1]|uniref:Uncharacterized protein n=1 Tax=Neolentinus lepideus HHB14362 ss-1 TaxID=1314782 RepID=A0A165S3R4_9AGAM|nr:hypothetical protein NEOLEDRAFT_1066681 [Neolentinus lepideus HHB14362 ss-1]
MSDVLDIINNDCEDELVQLAAIALVVLIGVEEARQLHNLRHNEQRQYLCCQHFMPNPRAWQQLHRSTCSGRAYIKTMGLDIQTFD